MRSDAWARQILASVWEQATGQKPTLPELQYVQAVAAFEGGYGGSWDGANNWGAIQCTEHKPPDCVPGHCFLTGDHKADGTAFTWCYRMWPSPEAGAADFIPLLTVRRPKTWAAMRKGDVREASHELYGYYSGIGTKEHIAQLNAARAKGDKAAIDAAMKLIREDGESQHRAAVMSNATRIAKNLGEPLKLYVSDKKSSDSGGLFLIGGGLLLAAVLLKKKGAL